MAAPRKPKAPADQGNIGFRGQHAAGLEAQETMVAGIRRHMVQSPVERMYARGSLTSRQYDAAQRLYVSYVLGIAGARDPERATGTGGYDPAGYSDARLAAATDYRKAVQAVGPLAWVLEWVVVQETTLEGLGQITGRSRETLKGYLEAALDVLADWYRLPGGYTMRQARSRAVTVDAAP